MGDETFIREHLEPFLRTGGISARRVETFLGFAAARALVFRKGRACLRPTQALQRATEQNGKHDMFKRGELVPVHGTQYTSTRSQFNLLMLLSTMPAQAFIQACTEHMAQFTQELKEARAREKRRRESCGTRKWSRIHLERKCQYAHPPSVEEPCDGVVTVGGDEVFV